MNPDDFDVLGMCTNLVREAMSRDAGILESHINERGANLDLADTKLIVGSNGHM